MLKLTSNELKIVKKILIETIPDYTVWAFGSRVSERSKPFSDLDLVIISEKPLSTLCLSQLREAFDESDLPFQVDLVEWSKIDREFKEIIKSNYEVVI